MRGEIVIDHVKPKERLRRHTDYWSFRVWHVTVFLIVVFLVSLGFADRVTRWGEQNPVSFKVESSCGL